MSWAKINRVVDAFTVAGSGPYTLDTGAAATGTLVLGGQPNDADTWRVSDGTQVVDFEFDSNSSVTQTPTLRQVVIGATTADTLNNLQAAISSADFTFNITPSTPVTGGTTVSLTHDVSGVIGNVSVVEAVNVSTNLSSTGMSGGVNPTGEAITPQRAQDERGVMSVHFSANPGAGKAGIVRLQGRLDPNLEWADIFLGVTRIQVDMGSATGPMYSLASVNIPIFPHMRVFTSDLASTNTVTISAFIIE